jgi:hypothetical protein
MSHSTKTARGGRNVWDLQVRDAEASQARLAVCKQAPAGVQWGCCLPSHQQQANPRLRA